LVLPFAAGGPTDTLARILADRMRVTLGQPVIVENVTGAAGTISIGRVVRAAPDGYTLSMGPWNSHVLTGALYTLAFDLQKDLRPIALIANNPSVIVSKTAAPATNLKELIAWIKANPDKATFASSGKGSSLHMAAELFKSMGGIATMLHVPYRGSSAAHPDLLGGRTAMIFDTITAILPHVQSGGVRALAVTTAKRSAALPDLPTIAESGLPGYDANTWGGILAPAGTPKEIVAKLNAEINKALATEDVRAKLTASGIDIQGGTPAEFGDYIKGEVVKWAKVTKEAGIQPE
jgi:tripartite-type tricarboxylate transporter receptor subunit TctC